MNTACGGNGMTSRGISRRGFGKGAVAAGIGAVLGGTAAGAPSAAAAPEWRATGTAVSALAGFDETMRAFMRERDVSAGQLAVTYQGRLVLARGYAWTDDAALDVQPTSLFRLASLSKPITGAAVARLVQEGGLDLSAPIGSLVDLEPPSGGSADPRLGDVTIRRLLHHLGGWDRASTPDPMFRNFAISDALGVPLPIGMEHVIRHTTGLPLDHDPGTAYAYSNYGYLLLGRAIEAVTGTDYPSYVQDEVLGPVGISRMRLGRSAAADAAPTEVPYRSQNTGTTVLDGSGATVPGPYGTFNLENMDSHGGWIGSAVDLVRFATIFDTPAATPVLNGTSISRVFAEPETGIGSGGSYYGFGWSVRPVASGGTGRNTWHTGGLTGTSTLLVRTYNGMSWAALFNQRDDPSGLSYGTIDPLLWEASRDVASWPSGDRFPDYFG
ncbi:serine hydrolase domain-containing protein [Nocardiopsis mangrovi]|uniref:Serine hydrolase domain-containing protein n=1 Tax=Nocardiopsis mangrovi TaxID=1179818 RepID=A0ABV9DY12_9ACTN